MDQTADDVNLAAGGALNGDIVAHPILRQIIVIDRSLVHGFAAQSGLFAQILA
jgi:hypothetical protein